jgi:NADPH-dependent glutamate synthase beta subunit-like oxidoreductase/Pyruvate/2-oxoacid:ferredoxin oxidoreductase delta subunit
MESCNRGQHDGAVNIRGLERWIGDHLSNYAVPVKNCPDPKRVAIVGGGPAGISAAYSLAKAGHQIDIFDGGGKLGGVLRGGIPAYRLPEEALDRDLDRLFSLGIIHKPHQVITPVEVKRLAEEYDAVIVATGQAASIVPEFPGIDLAGVEQGLTFLNRVKSNGPERIRGTVAVIGGGNTALDCAGTSIRCGADRVVIVYRRGRVEMPAIKEEIEDILAEGAELVIYRQPARITGNGVVDGIELAEVELGDIDKSGRRRPIVTHNLSTIACDHVLIAIGQRPNLGIFPQGWIVRDQRVYCGEQPMNVWSAGDLTTGDGTVAHAIGNGRRIANNVLNFLEKRPSSDTEPSSSIPELVTAETIRFSHFPVKESQHDRRIEVSKRISSFQEVNEGLSDTAESGRCFSCGHCVQCDTCLIYCPEGIITRKSDDYVINPDYCKGCGICVWECPRHALGMSAEGYRSKS